MKTELRAEKKYTKYEILLWSVLSSLVVMLIAVIKIGGGTAVYETNNDRIINEIFSGAMTGKPDPHAIYVNYILGVWISGLYRITKEIPWYGLFLLGCYFVIYCAVLTVVLKKGRNLRERCGLWLLCMLVIVCNLYIFSVLQFTTIAGALAVAGYVWLLLDDRKKRSYILFGLFEVFAVLVRRDAMLMVQPIGMCVVGAFLVTDLLKDNRKIKTSMIELCRIALIATGAFVVFLFGNYVYGDYDDPEWKRYMEYNDLCVKLIDYYEYPEYEECREILEKYNVSELEYEAIAHYYVLDNVLENECMEEMLPVALEHYQEQNPISIIGIMKRMVNYFRYDNCFGYELAVPVMYLFVCVCFILSKRWKALLPVAALLFSRYTIFAYLIVRGRITTGVINILFFAELYFLLAIWCKIHFTEQAEHTKYTKVRYAVMTVFVGIMLAAAGRSYSEAKKSNTWIQEYEKAIMKIFDYMEEKEAGFIVCDEVTTYYMGTALHTKRYKTQNSLVAGGWFYNSPMMNEAVQAYKEKYADNMYCIVFKDVPGFDHSYVLELLPKKYDVTLELADTLYLEELGLGYEVYRLNGSLK